MKNKGFDGLVHALTICVCAFPFLWTCILIFVWKIPFWLYTDPDLFYFANGVNFLLHGTVGVYTNPGIVTEMLCGIFMLPVYVIAKFKGVSLPEFSISYAEGIVFYLKLAFSLMVSGAIYLLSLSLRRITKTKEAGIITPLFLLSLSLVSVDGTRIMPEATAITLCGVWLYLYSHALENISEIQTDKHLYGMSFVAGLALANKYTALPMVLVSLVLSLKSWRALLCLIGGFILGILPVIVGPPYLMKFFASTGNFLVHRGTHGAGEIGWSTFNELLNGVGMLIFQEKYYFLLLVVFLCLMVFNKGNAKLYNGHGNLFLICGVIFLPISFRYAIPYYATVSLLLISIFLVMRVSGHISVWSTNIKYGIFFVLLVACSFNIYRTFNVAGHRVELCSDLNNFSADILQKKNSAIAFGWSEPFLPPWALMVANHNARNVFLKVLERKFPSYFLIDVEENKVLLSSGKIIPLEKPLKYDYVFFPYEFTRCCFSELFQGVRYKTVKNDSINELTLIKIEK